MAGPNKPSNRNNNNGDNNDNKKKAPIGFLGIVLWAVVLVLLLNTCVSSLQNASVVKVENYSEFKEWVAAGYVDTVDMGVPVLESLQPEKITVTGSEWEFSAVDVGSPHAVYLVPNCEEVPLEKIGVLFEHAARFPNRVNSEFVQILDRTHLRMRVWERGSGITLACGTGAVASVVASHARGLTDASVEVQMDGGALRIEIDDTTGHAFMTGPAVEVFQGETTLVD